MTLNQILNDALPSSSTSESETQEAINKKRISNTILLQAIEHTQTSFWPESCAINDDFLKKF